MRKMGEEERRAAARWRRGWRVARSVGKAMEVIWSVLGRCEECERSRDEVEEGRKGDGGEARGTQWVGRRGLLSLPERFLGAFARADERWKGKSCRRIRPHFSPFIFSLCDSRNGIRASTNQRTIRSTLYAHSQLSPRLPAHPLLLPQHMSSSTPCPSGSASRSFNDLPTETKAYIVKLCAEQDEAWRQFAEKAERSNDSSEFKAAVTRGDEWHGQSISSLFQVSRLFSELAAPYRFRVRLLPFHFAISVLTSRLRR
jgi:hypothetical protein